jgi:hypothetical protein
LARRGGDFVYQSFGEQRLDSFHRCLVDQYAPPSSLPSPPNDVGFNLIVGPDAAPSAVNPTTKKRNHVGAIVIFTKQFHQFPGWGFVI